jgi:glutamyl-tRNA reductase
MDLVVIGLSHRTAPVSLRERLATAPGETEARLRALAALPGVREAALISTCNRVEIYASASDGAEALASLRAHLRGHVPGSGADRELDPHLFAWSGRDAVLHLFRVAASLDSLVIGEPQILGQVKEAFETAQRVGTAGPQLGAAFSRAFRVARKVRRETAIAENPVSVSSVAVDCARQVWGSFEGRRVLLVGAGKMADLAARALRADGATVAVTNRTRSRADDLAARLGCSVEPYEALAEALGRADIVISSTGAREPILRAPFVKQVQRARRGRPLVLVDIAVPRDVEPEVANLPGVFLFDIDALQTVVAQNMSGRRQEADRAEALVLHEVSEFVVAHRGRSVGSTIAALRAKVQGVARAEAEKTLAGLPGLDERTRRAMLQLADAIANKLLHPPSVALKREAGGQSQAHGSSDADGLVTAVQKLFDLPRVEALEAQGEPDERDRAADPDAEPGKRAARS